MELISQIMRRVAPRIVLKAIRFQASREQKSFEQVVQEARQRLADDHLGLNLLDAAVQLNEREK